MGPAVLVADLVAELVITFIRRNAAGGGCCERSVSVRLLVREKRYARFRKPGMMISIALVVSKPVRIG